MVSNILWAKYWGTKVQGNITFFFAASRLTLLSSHPLIQWKSWKILLEVKAAVTGS
jgi:hypothetical protein